MSNLAKTQAEWTRLIGEELAGLILAPIREAREQRDKFSRERFQIVNIGDTTSATPHITALTLTGVDYTANTSTEGRLYVRFVANASNWNITFYTAAGASGSVATVTNLAASGTAALVAANSSGLGGSITLGATIAGDVTDKHQILVIADYPARLPKVLTQTDSIDDDQFSRRDIAAFYARCAARRQAEITDARAVISQWALSAAGNPVARGNTFTGTNYSVLASDTPVEDSSGNVTRSRTGWFYFTKDAMEDEGTGGEQDVVRRVPSAGAGSFDAGNDGAGTVASHTPTELALPGVHTFEVVSDTLGSERFSHSFKASDSDLVESTDAGPVVGKLWSGARGFGPITVTRTLSKTNDGSNLRFAAASGCVVTGETSLNTDDGDIYITLVANSTNWDISFFSASSLHSSTLVAKATNIAASAAFTATEQNSSGLTVSWTLGGTVTAVTNIVLSLSPFKLQNANGVPDKFTVTVTLAASPGLIQTILAEEVGAILNSDTSGSESISDNYAKQGTFVPFITLDN